MNRSVLEAIQSGDWTYEPGHAHAEFRATDAVPGSPEKLEILARRIQAGLPLWHPDDRTEPELANRHQADPRVQQKLLRKLHALVTAPQEECTPTAVSDMNAGDEQEGDAESVLVMKLS